MKIKKGEENRESISEKNRGNLCGRKRGKDPWKKRENTRDSGELKGCGEK